MLPSWVPLVSSLLVLLVNQFDASRASIIFNERHFPSFQLPRHLHPVAYYLNMTLKNDIRDLYPGEVSIEVNVIKQIANLRTVVSCCKEIFQSCLIPDDTPFEFTMSHIVLHADPEMELLDATYTDLGDIQRRSAGGAKRSIPIIDHEKDKAKQMITFKLAKDLKLGSRGMIWIKFNAQRQELNALGIYRTQLDHKVPGSKARPAYIVGSFEPTGARLAFPCFDELDFRAKVRLDIFHSYGDSAVSSLIPNSKEDIDLDLVKQTFHESKSPMPLNKLSFVVGVLSKFELTIDDEEDDDVPVAIWAHPYVLGQCEFAFVAAKISKGYMKISAKIEFPLEKLELVAVPEYPRKMMSGHGLSLVRHDLLLLDPNDEPIKRIEISELMVKLLARQYFGNRVAPKTWRDHWVVESLAGRLEMETIRCLKVSSLREFGETSRMYFKRSQALRIEFIDNRPHGLVLSSAQQNEDAPNAPLTSSDEICRLVLERPQLSAKAAVFSNLLQKRVGDRAYILLTKTLISKEQYMSIDLEDLVDAAKVYDEPGMRVAINELSPWYERGGYPLLVVSYIDLINQIDVRQQIFGPANEVSSAETNWPTQLEVTFGEAKHQRTVEPVINGRARVPIWFSLNDKEHWLKLGIRSDESTYYRVEYSDRLMANLRIAIEKEYIRPVDRIQVLDDAFALTEIGRLSFKKFDKILRWYYEPRDSASHHHSEIMYLLKISERLQIDLRDSLFSDALTNYINVLSYIPNEETPGIQLHAHLQALKKLVEIDHPSVVNELLSRASEMEDLTVFEQEPTYTTFVKHGQSWQVGVLINMLESTDSRPGQLRLARALAHAREYKMIKRLYHWLRANVYNEKLFSEIIHTIRSHSPGRLLEPRLRSVYSPSGNRMATLDPEDIPGPSIIIQ